jgi:hypothetical protein
MIEASGMKKRAEIAYREGVEVGKAKLALGQNVDGPGSDCRDRQTFDIQSSYKMIRQTADRQAG